MDYPTRDYLAEIRSGIVAGNIKPALDAHELADVRDALYVGLKKRKGEAWKVHRHLHSIFKGYVKSLEEGTGFECFGHFIPPVE